MRATPVVILMMGIITLLLVAGCTTFSSVKAGDFGHIGEGSSEGNTSYPDKQDVMATPVGPQQTGPGFTAILNDEEKTVNYTVQIAYKARIEGTMAPVDITRNTDKGGSDDPEPVILWRKEHASWNSVRDEKIELNFLTSGRAGEDYIALHKEHIPADVADLTYKSHNEESVIVYHKMFGEITKSTTEDESIIYPKSPFLVEIDINRHDLTGGVRISMDEDLPTRKIIKMVDIDTEYDPAPQKTEKEIILPTEYSIGCDNSGMANSSVVFDYNIGKGGVYFDGHQYRMHCEYSETPPVREGSPEAYEKTYRKTKELTVLIIPA